MRTRPRPQPQAATTAHSSPWWIARTIARPRRRMTPSRPAPGIRYWPTGRKSRSRTGTPGTLSHRADGMTPARRKLPQLAAVVEDVHVHEERARGGNVELRATGSATDPHGGRAFDAVAKDAGQHEGADAGEKAARGDDHGGGKRARLALRLDYARL